MFVTLVVTAVGVIIALFQFVHSKKVERAKLLLELYSNMINDKEVMESFYKIDWSTFSRG